MQSFSVRPKEPTILGDTHFYELQHFDVVCSFTSVDTVHVVPGPIDLELFNDALSRTLSWYPLAAGRLVTPSSKESSWKIRLINSGVPVTVVDNDTTQIFATDTVVQTPVNFVQPVNPTKIAVVGSDEPLIRITLTRFTSLGRTAIGMSSIHSIGDGWCVSRFQRLLSQNYQGLDPLDPPPSYQRFSIPPDLPAGLLIDDDIPHQPHQPSSNKDSHKVSPPVRVDLRFTAAQLRAIHEGLLGIVDMDDKSNRIFSRLDTIVALLTHSISQADTDSPPIHCVTTVINHRGMGYAHENATGNALMWTRAELPLSKLRGKSTKQTILAMMKEIRASITAMRDINHLSTFMTKSGVFRLSSTEMGQIFHPPLGHITINSTWRFEWSSAHFGYPHRTSFFTTTTPASRFVKVYAPNPGLLPDGTIRDVRSGDMEVTLHLLADAKERLKTILQANAEEVGMHGQVEFA